MTIGWVDRTIFNATSAGLGDFVVASAVTGYLTPAQSSAIDGENYHYAAQSVDGSGNITDWEVGTGVYTASTTTLARTTVEFSSNSNNKVNFATAPQVMLTALAQDFETARQVLTANRTYYVATTGSDSTGNGSVGSPWATPQHALNVIGASIDLAGFTVNIQCADGTYPGVQVNTFPLGFGNLASLPPTGGGVNFLGNAADNTKVVWTDTGSLIAGFSCFDTETPCNIALRYITIAPSANLYPITIDSDWSIIQIMNCRFVAPVGGTTVGMSFFNPMGHLLLSNIEIVGNWGFLAKTFGNGSGSQIVMTGTITLTGTPAFSEAFLIISDLSVGFSTSTFSGSATGKRFIVSNGGVIDTGTNNLTLFPGNVAGDILPGGQYDIYSDIPGIYTVGTLPTGVLGMEAVVTDGDANLKWGDTVVNSGGGDTRYLVWFNSYVWSVIGRGVNTFLGAINEVISLSDPTDAVAGYVGPGDVVSGALAWWGLRAYSAATAGNNCLDIQRASDSVTQTFQTLTNGLLDTASIATFLTATTGTVTKLYDQTGNGFDLAGGVPPAYATGPLISFNGNPSVQYLIASSTLTQAAPFSVSFVAKRTGNTSAWSIVVEEGTGFFLSGFYPAPDLAAIYGGGAGSAAATDNALHAVQAVLATGSNSSLYVDGALTSGLTIGTPACAGTPSIGGPFGGFVGDYLEGGIWAGSFNGTQQSDMNSNQHTFWSF